jgi:hypothetical protein
MYHQQEFKVYYLRMQVALHVGFVASCLSYSIRISYFLTSNGYQTTGTVNMFNFTHGIAGVDAHQLM